MCITTYTAGVAQPYSATEAIVATVPGLELHYKATRVCGGGGGELFSWV